MILGEKFKSRSSILETYSLYFVIAWTFIVGGFLLFGIFQIRHIQQEMVKILVRNARWYGSGALRGSGPGERVVIVKSLSSPANDNSTYFV